MTEETKKPGVDQQEIATVAKDITYLAFQGILRSRDTTLETRGGAKSYAIYDDIERDCHAYGVLQKRKLAVVARPWQVDPASKSKADVMAADMVRAQLSAMGTPAEDTPGDQVVMAGNFDLVCYNLLDAILKGFAVGEIMWDIDGKQIVARDIRPKDQRRFNFDTDYKLRLKTWSQLIPGEMVPPRKFIVHTFGAKDGSPYGNGVGSRLFWPTFFKRQDITFWLTYLDKFGSPTAVGKYPNGTPKGQQDDLLSALSAIAQDAGVAIPEGMVIELLEAKRSGSVTYEQFARYMDEEMTFAVLGEAPTSKGGGGAQQTAALAREEVRLELVQADADLLSATLNATLSPWLTAYNVPGARPPKIWRQVQEAEDLKARSERDANLFAIGYRPTLAEVTKTYGGEWEAVPVPADPKRPPYTASSAFAETDTAPFTDDQLAARLSVEGAQPWNALLAQIRAIVDGATSLPDLRDQLLAAFGNLDSNALAKVMQAGFAVAELAGIADVNDGQ